MGLANTQAAFGAVTRAIHWATAAVVLVALPMGLWLANSEISLSMLKYYGIHKTLGITALALTLLRLLWHRLSHPPAPLPHGVLWQDTLARMVHRALYLLLILMPLSGWVASSASGIDTVVFGQWTLPAIAPVSETWESTGFMIHGLTGYALILLLGLHVGGALFRAVIKRDGTLWRMLA